MRVVYVLYIVTALLRYLCRTAEPQNRRSADPENSRTAEPQNRRTADPDLRFCGSAKVPGKCSYYIYSIPA